MKLGAETKEAKGLMLRTMKLKLSRSYRDPSPSALLRVGDFGKGLISLTCLTSLESPGYYAPSMYSNRFSFAFTYRYYFTGSGEADGVLTMQK